MFNRAVSAFRKGINKKSKSNLSSDDESTASVVSSTSSIQNDSASSSISVPTNGRRRRRGEGTLRNLMFCLLKSNVVKLHCRLINSKIN